MSQGGVRQSRAEERRKGIEGRQGGRVNKESKAIKWEISRWEIEENKYKVN